MGPPSLEASRRELQGHKKAVNCLAWSAGGKRLASGDADAAVRVWNVEASASAKPERCELAMGGQGGPVNGVEWHPKRDDQIAVLTERTVRLFDTRAAAKPFVSVSMAASLMAWHPDGNMIAVSNFRSHDVRFIDVRKGQVVGHSPPFGDREPGKLRFLGNGSTLLVATFPGDIDVLHMSRDLKSAARGASLCGHLMECEALALDPQHKYLASGGFDSLVNIWDVDHATVVAAVPYIEFPVKDLSFSADGRRLAVAQEKGGVVIVSAPSGRAEGAVPTGACRAVAWHPKHAGLLAHGADGAQVWTNEGRHTDEGGAIGLAFFGGGGR